MITNLNLSSDKTSQKKWPDPSRQLPKLKLIRCFLKDFTRMQWCGQGNWTIALAQTSCKIQLCGLHSRAIKTRASKTKISPSPKPISSRKSQDWAESEEVQLQWVANRRFTSKNLNQQGSKVVHRNQLSPWHHWKGSWRQQTMRNGWKITIPRSCSRSMSIINSLRSTIRVAKTCLMLTDRELIRCLAAICHRVVDRLCVKVRIFTWAQKGYWRAVLGPWARPRLTMTTWSRTHSLWQAFIDHQDLSLRKRSKLLNIIGKATHLRRIISV